MGLLSLGEPLSWSETKFHAEYIREAGIRQFINLFNLCKDKTSHLMKFGDEIEYLIVVFDDEKRKVRVSNRAIELLNLLQKPENDGELNLNSLWRPEFGAYMIEGTPGSPYSIVSLCFEKIIKNDKSIGCTKCNNLAMKESQTFAFLNEIEINMRTRRQIVQELLNSNESVLSISSFPTLGTFDFCLPKAFVHPTHGYGQSLFFPDEAIYHGHPRFKTLVNNIRERKGQNVEIYLPIYQDKNTARPFEEDFVQALNVDKEILSEDEYESYKQVALIRQEQYRKVDQVYMDAMGFGMGCCCLQVTFQASNLDEACNLYDQLAPLCPILMALSAASPIFRGYLTDVDCRWTVISQSVDDRTKNEINGTEETSCIPKSRFDSIDLYISSKNSHYNDVNIVYNEQYFNQLLENNIPKTLAQHIAHLFIRDPLVLFKEKLDIDDTKESDHFENIQSTNWQTMRFKPPPIDNLEIGWRVEFRPMEVQLTDHENAAYVIFVVLLTRLILSVDLNLLIPMSKVEENMKLARKRDALRNARFWFRKDVFFSGKIYEHFSRIRTPDLSELNENLFFTKQTNCDELNNLNSCCTQLTIDEIINGTKDGAANLFPGLIPLINLYLDSIDIDAKTRCILNNYLHLISKRAEGKLPTAAQSIRAYVTKHPEYKHDSVITDGIAYDLLKLISKLQSDQITMDEFIDIIY